MVLNYTMLVLLILFSFVFIYCCAKAKSYDNYIAPLDDKEFAGKELYGVGFAFLDLIKFDFTSESVQKIRDQIVIIHGKKYSDFYLRVSYAQKFSYAILIIYFSLALACIVGGSDGAVLAGLGVVVAIVSYVYYSSVFQQKIDKLSNQYMSDFPNAISNIALLVNAGMFLRDAWKAVAYSEDGPLFDQMKMVVEDMNNGIAEIDALFAFSNRCATPEIRKFVATIIQAIDKGGKELTSSLSNQADGLWNAKKQRTLQAGEKAANKLMIPIVIMFVGILVVIIVPIFANLGI